MSSDLGGQGTGHLHVIQEPGNIMLRKCKSCLLQQQEGIVFKHVESCGSLNLNSGLSTREGSHNFVMDDTANIEFCCVTDVKDSFSVLRMLQLCLLSTPVVWKVASSMKRTALRQSSFYASRARTQVGKP